MNRILGVLSFIALFPTVALAQSESAAPPVKDRAAVTYNEIERGFYFGVGGGWSFLLEAPGPSGSNRPFSPGTMARVEMGMDIGERLSLGIFGMGTTNQAGSDYIGESAGTSSGDFFAFVPGATLRVNAVGFLDDQEVRRTWLYLRGSAGLVMWRPKDLLPNSDVLISVGPGVEYYTRLRHFSVGLEVLFNYLASSSSMGFGIVPNLRYSF